MRSVLFAVLIFTLAVGLSYAQYGKDAPGRSYRAYSYKVRGSGIGRYQTMLENMLIASKDLELTDEQKKKIEEIRDEYLEALTDETREYRKLHLSIYKSLQDPSFDAAEVKNEINKSEDLGKKIAYQFVDGISMLRDTLGPEKYEKVNSAAFRYKKDLIQLRSKQLQRIKSSPPPAAENGGNADSKDEDGSTDEQE